jgi:hypothetical protein
VGNIRADRRAVLVMERPPKYPTPEKVYRRIMAKAERTPAGCLESLYSHGSHGYTQVGWHEPGYSRPQMLLTHRAVWQWVYGEIPDGMTVDHLCHNRACVEIAHLRILTNYENARRTSGRDWPLGQCVNGHPNEHIQQFGAHRHCSVYAKEWKAAYERRQREAA